MKYYRVGAHAEAPTLWRPYKTAIFIQEQSGKPLRQGKQPAYFGLVGKGACGPCG
ncbi:hypothetical protein ACQE3E_00845 [Methylomonas sp. MED-D]|uniref:hypothetical protein n=1 Tax=unclassified Methylomonas TaxID=2608980 RepID=UPI00158702C8|nr:MULTISPECIES: hypothetical protein [unclassified Methylomonas]MDT4330544.1 hypothetical protein [Methylomonas sp. MV1]